MQGRRTITLAVTGAIDGDKMSGPFSPRAVDGKIVPGAPFANRASLAGVSPHRTRLKTMNTDFDCSSLLSYLLSYLLLQSRGRVAAA